MARILIYTSPARGHLFPVIGAGVELKARGHEVHLRTLAPEVDRVRSLGLSAEPIAASIEARELDDLRLAVERTRAEALLVDTNCWGAQAVAEASGLPWATFQPYFAALPAPGVPPFGPGLRRSRSGPGRVRDALLRRLIFSKMNRVAMPAVNEMRARLGLGALAGITDLLHRPPLVFYFTTREIEYPRRPNGLRRLNARSRWSPVPPSVRATAVSWRPRSTVFRRRDSTWSQRARRTNLRSSRAMESQTAESNAISRTARSSNAPGLSSVTAGWASRSAHWRREYHWSWFPSVVTSSRSRDGSNTQVPASVCCRAA